MTQTEAKWAERVHDWRASGRTAAEYAEGRVFKASTLRFWASRLRTKSQAEATRPMPQGEAAAVRLVRVRRRSERAPSPSEGVARATARGSTSDARMVIALGAARIEVRSGFDRALLRDVLEALGGAR